MSALIACLHLFAFVGLGLAMALPRWRRLAAALLGAAAVASLVAGAVDPGERTLETVHTYTGFDGGSLDIGMVAFPTGSVTAPGWQWPQPFAAFAVVWIAWSWRRRDATEPAGLGTALAFAWTATAAWLGMQALAAPSAVVQPLGLDRFLFPASLAVALGTARTARGLLGLMFAVSASIMFGRLPAALFSKYASDWHLGTSLDISKVRDIVNPIQRLQFEPRLESGSSEQQFWLIWLEHVIVFPALYMMSLAGIGFCALMFHRHGDPHLRKVA